MSGHFTVSPFGLATCCICDAKATHAIPTERREFLPYCAADAKAMKDEFPDSRVYVLAFPVTCPDCGVGTIDVNDRCGSCGLAYEDLTDAAKFLAEQTPTTTYVVQAFNGKRWAKVRGAEGGPWTNRARAERVARSREAAERRESSTEGLPHRVVEVTS
jgi:hypothetical protein